MAAQSGKTGRFSYPFRPDSGHLKKESRVSSLNKPQKSFFRENGQKEGTPFYFFGRGALKCPG